MDFVGTMRWNLGKSSKTTDKAPDISLVVSYLGLARNEGMDP